MKSAAVVSAVAVLAISCPEVLVNGKMLEADAVYSAYLAAEGHYECGKLSGNEKTACEAEKIQVQNAELDREQAEVLKSSERQVRISMARKVEKRAEIKKQGFMAEVLNGLKHTSGRMENIAKTIKEGEKESRPPVPGQDDPEFTPIRINITPPTEVATIVVQKESDEVQTATIGSRLDAIISANDANISSFMADYANHLAGNNQPTPAQLTPAWGGEPIPTSWVDFTNYPVTPDDRACPLTVAFQDPNPTGVLISGLQEALKTLIDSVVTDWGINTREARRNTLKREFPEFAAPVLVAYRNKSEFAKVIKALLNLIDFVHAWRAARADRNAYTCDCTSIAEEYKFGFTEGNKSYCCGTKQSGLPMYKKVSDPFFLQELFTDLAIALLPINGGITADGIDNIRKQIVADAKAINDMLANARQQPIVTDVTAMLHNIENKKPAGAIVYTKDLKGSGYEAAPPEFSDEKHEKTEEEIYLEEAGRAAKTVSDLEESLENLMRHKSDLDRLAKKHGYENDEETMNQKYADAFFQAFLTVFLAPTTFLAYLLKEKKGDNNAESAENTGIFVTIFTTLLLFFAMVSQANVTKRIASIVSRGRGISGVGRDSNACGGKDSRARMLLERSSSKSCDKLEEEAERTSVGPRI